MFTKKDCSIIVDNSFFNSNAEYSSSIVGRASTFNCNEAGNIVGVVCAYNNSGITVYNSSFKDNKTLSKG